MLRKIMFFALMMFVISCDDLTKDDVVNDTDDFVDTDDDTDEFTGSISASASAILQDSYTLLGGVAGFEFELNSNDPTETAGDPTGFVFELSADGDIDDGGNDDIGDAFDGGSEFHFDAGDTFSLNIEFPDRAIDTPAEAYVEDVDGDTVGDQVVYVATSDGGLEVTRKVWVAPTYDCGSLATACGLARYLDCIDNPTIATATVTPEIYSDLGSDGDGVVLGRADVEDSLAHPFYFAHEENGDSDTRLAYVLGNSGSAALPALAEFDPESDEDIELNWGSQDIPAGERACFVHYVILGNTLNDNAAGDNPTSDIFQLARDIFADPLVDGIQNDEIADIRNFSDLNLLRMNVVGEDDSVPADAEVVLTNIDTDVSVTAESDENGAFNASINCNSGDTIEVTAEGVAEEFICE